MSAHLITHPSPVPTRKVLAATLGGALGGPVVGWASLQLLGFELSPECAAEIGTGLFYAVLGLGGLVSGALTFIAGYLTPDRAPAAGGAE
jgi:hypothetical protein